MIAKWKFRAGEPFWISSTNRLRKGWSFVAKSLNCPMPIGRVDNAKSGALSRWKTADFASRDNETLPKSEVGMTRLEARRCSVVVPHAPEVGFAVRRELHFGPHPGVQAGRSHL